MDKDRRESKGQGTLLLMMKRKPKAWVSCLKEFMEAGLRPSNYLIAIDPRMDGNTLHIKASAHYILRVKGDLEIRSRALLMASFTRPLWGELL